MLEKISRIKSALGSPAGPRSRSPKPANPDATGAIYDRIAASLRTLRNLIAERISSLAHQVLQDEIDFLQQLSLRERAALSACIARIDHHILRCVAGIDEARKIHHELAALNRELVRLDAGAEPLADGFFAQDYHVVIDARLKALTQIAIEN